MNKNKNLAFTLAEVLIVIGIIGVVAALTLPNLNHATGDKETVTKVKKIYSTLTEAVDRAQAIYGPLDTWFKDLGDEDWAAQNERFAKRVTEFMKVSKDCGFDEGCFSSAPILLVSGDIDEENDLQRLQELSAYMVTIADGMSLAFFGSGSLITVDIDGPNKGKNQDGIDRFSFEIMSNNLNPCPNVASPNYEFLSTSPDYYFAWWVIENENLDYLKCPDELNWETKTSCE